METAAERIIAVRGGTTFITAEVMNIKTTKANTELINAMTTMSFIFLSIWNSFTTHRLRSGL